MFLCKTLFQEPSNDPGIMQGKERGLLDLSYVARRYFLVIQRVSCWL